MPGQIILKACKIRGLSLSKACAIAGLNYSTLHSQIRHQRQIPFATIDRFRTALNFPIGFFSELKSSITVEPNENASDLQAEAARALSDLMAKQVAAMATWGFRIGTDDVLDWLLANDSTLVNHEWLLDRIDLFYPPKPGDIMIRPYRIGANSLVARYFKLTNPEDYTKTIAKFERPLLEQVVQAHLDAASLKYLVTDHSINQTVDGTRVTGTYRRLIAPVRDVNGQQFSLVFSKLTQFSSA